MKASSDDLPAAARAHQRDDFARRDGEAHGSDQRLAVQPDRYPVED